MAAGVGVPVHGLVPSVCHHGASTLSALSAAQLIGKVDPAILPSSSIKIEASINAFDDHAITEPLMAGFDSLEHKLTPSRFLHWMRQEAKAHRQRIVLPESSDHRILAAANNAQQKEYADIVLLGNDAEVRQVRGAVASVRFDAHFVDLLVIACDDASVRRMVAHATQHMQRNLKSSDSVNNTFQVKR
jgi:Phosphate acetyl/butaryl transferase